MDIVYPITDARPRETSFVETIRLWLHNADCGSPPFKAFVVRPLNDFQSSCNHIELGPGHDYRPHRHITASILISVDSRGSVAS
jgi:hypothetical protein